MPKAFVVLIVALSLAVAGCSGSQKNPLIGTWETHYKQEKQSVSIREVYAADGTFTFQIRFSNPRGGQDIAITTRGSYTYTKNSVTTTPTEFAYSGIAKDQLPGVKAETEKTKNVAATDKLEWVTEYTYKKHVQGTVLSFTKKD